MAFISAQRQMVITYGEPAPNCQGTKVSPCEYCGSAGGCGRRVSTSHVVPEEIRNPQAGGDDIKGDHTVGFSDGTRAVIAFPDLRHRCTRFPSPVCRRGRASLIYAGKFNTAPTSHDSYPTPIWTYPEPKHTCKSYPCSYCGKQGYNNWWGCDHELSSLNILKILKFPTSSEILITPVRPGRFERNFRINGLQSAFWIHLFISWYIVVQSHLSSLFVVPSFFSVCIYRFIVL